MGVVLVCTPESQAPLGFQYRVWEGAGLARSAGKGGREVLSLPPAEAGLPFAERMMAFGSLD